MKIFISYALEDKKAAMTLVNALRHAGQDVVVNALGISSGEAIHDIYTTLFRNVDLIIAIFSVNYEASKWCKAELSAALMANKDVNFFPIVVGNIILPNYISDVRYISIENLVEIDDASEAIIAAIHTYDETETNMRKDNIDDLAKYNVPKSYMVHRANKKEADIEDIVGLLKDALSNRRLTLVCGAGISKSSSFPGWDDLITDILNNSFKELDGSKIVTHFPQSNIIVGKYLKLILKDEFDNAVRHSLYKSRKKADGQKLLLTSGIPDLKQKPLSDTLKAIATIARPSQTRKRLDSIITFNFDDLVEKALEQEGIAYRPIWKEGQSRNDKTFPIFHVHGYLPSDGELDEPNLVFSEDTYHSQFINPYSWSNLVQLNTYSENVCLFIGLSLADPNLRRLLDISHRNNNQCKNYIVMCREPNPDREAKMASMLFEQDANSLGLNVIMISDYLEIPLILKKLAK